MAKKKAKKKTKKISKKKTLKKKKSPKKKLSRKKKAKGLKIPAEKQTGEKMVGMIEHFFHNIWVAAIKIKAPVKVGDTLHFKGHTTDFTQKIDSMQIEHKNVEKVKKGDDIGIKVRSRVRENDIVYLASETKQTVAPTPSPIQKPTPPPKPKSSDPYAGQKFLKF